ncbi:uncharacterized protein F4822DRAFT_424976 [Hypoxylon trugodes]|uniref:uncharacterized protein n=1 Tax=Hypoxylon trugodes TaxID=326681 RepID=UPI00219372B6|nr:uncharacterized protein F4822DRAFT_424976 [Hypoxylon trugodes]KAI1391755.1 hypothetical protein F4822DRAFT_424976 [Hypoxylon trugodes]
MSTSKIGTQNGGQGVSPSFESIHIKNTTINEDAGVELSSHQKVLVGSVLDLFEGNPTLKHLSLWSPNGTFTDPITIATGYNKFAAQWYGLPALFNPIQIQSHSVTSAGNPIEMNLSNKYVVKGIKTGQTINSVVRIHVGQDGKVEKVEDRWNDKLPEGVVSEALRKLNANTVPTFVTVPKDEAEDQKLKAEREKNS